MERTRRATVGTRAKASAAKFDTFQKDTRTKALADFKATHAWTRDADEDKVKDTVAYLLSKEGGRYGSKRFSGPGTPSGGKPGTYSSPPPPSTATPTNPAADAVTAAATTPSGRRAMAPLEGAKLNAYRERYNIKPADYSSDGSLERLEVRDRQAASRRRRSKRTGGGGDTYEYNR